MSLYRKKPVVVEARQFTPEFGQEIAAWCGGRYHIHQPLGPYRPVIEIDTLEGMHQARLGDWIIKGVQGEFYPCRDDIFRETYEAVSGDAAR